LNQIVVNRTSQFNVLMPLLVVLLVVVLTLLYALSQSKSGWAIAGVKLKERNREIGRAADELHELASRVRGLAAVGRRDVQEGDLSS
jgi:energy-converting hydrogenase Eha subunit H